MNFIARRQIAKHHRAIALWERKPKLMTAMFLLGVASRVFNAHKAVQRRKELEATSTTTSRTGSDGPQSNRRSTRPGAGPLSHR